MAKAYFKIEGMKELQRSFKKLGAVPQKHVSTTARKGMNIALKESKANAPEDKGYLKKGMKLYGEKSRTKGKKVYRVIFDEAYNDIFQKKSIADKVMSVKNSKGKMVKKTVKAGTVTGYYPISQEYGYFTKNGRYIPGFRFIRNSLVNNAPKITRVIITDMQKKMDMEIRKAGLK